LRRYSDA